MTQASRAAQFAPFAALNGYGAAVEETARLTECEIEPDECAVEEIDRRLRFLAERINCLPEAEITYFKPDSRKKGGEYVCVKGRVKEIDEIECRVVLADGTKIIMGGIRRIEIPDERFGENGGMYEV